MRCAWKRPARLSISRKGAHARPDRALTAVQSHQDINLEGIGDADVIAVEQSGNASCVQVFFFRAGCNFGNRAYYPDHSGGEAPEAVLEAFIGQFYDQRPPPPCVMISHSLPNQPLVEEALSLRAERRVRVQAPQRGPKYNLVRHALDNAREALARRLGERVRHSAACWRDSSGCSNWRRLPSGSRSMTIAMSAAPRRWEQ